MKIGRIFGTVFLTAGCVGFVAPTAAGATSVTAADPIADNGAGFDPRGDIDSFSISDDGTTITGTFTVRTYDDPAGANWQAYYTQATFTFDAYGGSLDSPTEYIDVYNDGFAVITDAYGNCSPTLGLNPAARSYSVSIPAACLGNPLTVRLGIDFGYETESANSFDTVAWSPLVHADAPDGYWMMTAAGTVYPFGDVQSFGNPASSGSVFEDFAATPTGRGYWTIDQNGTVTAFGDATWEGNANTAYWWADEVATSISATPNGAGYWIFTNYGRVLDFGFAESYGGLERKTLNGPVLDSIPTPSGLGYYMVASDGGIFAFGDAAFYGSMGDKHLNAPVQSLVPDPDGRGYWLVASDGGVFAFEAGFRGSMGDKQLNKPMKGMVAYGDGYLMVGTDGGIFNFSNRAFRGSLGGNPPASQVQSVAVSG